MRTIRQIYTALRRKNRRDYTLLTLCRFISVLLITSFAVVMQSRTVQTMLPDGGDSRKQMTMIFTLAIAGCAVFTCYAASLFFRSKSREMGVFMALGLQKRSLWRLLFADLVIVCGLSDAAGLLLGFPLAAGIWNLFRMLAVNSQEMVFLIDFSCLLWPLAFSALCTCLLFLMGWRFIRRSNLIDVISTQRKSDPVQDVKGWYGIAGVLLMVLGAGGALFIPALLAGNGYTPPVWTNLLFLFAAAGLYMLLLFIVVRGFGGKKSYYRNIITRSMMKFQGRQTVLNMCVISVLVMAAYFAMFYSPMKLGPAMAGFAGRPVDNAFHYRADEAAIPGQADIERMAEEAGVALRDYREVEFVNLAADGYDREWTEDGRFGNEYHAFYTEQPILSQSAFQAISGMAAEVPSGQYLAITQTGYTQSPYDYFEEMTLFTNPDTMGTLTVKFHSRTEYDMLHKYIVLNDADYAAVTQGLGLEWREKWVQFNVDNEADAYAFESRLKNAIIDGSSEKSAVFENYDRIERINAYAAGREYRGDTEPDLQVRYEDRESSQFNQYWRYIPMFRVLDRNNFVINTAVFLMLFTFMALICMAAVIVIACTRCFTIAAANRQVYDDLRRLGANRRYLYHSVKGQVSRVFFVPAAIGTLGIYGFFSLMLYANNGALDAGELLALTINTTLLAVTSIMLWGIYRVTLGKVSQILGVQKSGAFMKRAR